MSLSDKRLDDFCYFSSAKPFKIVLQKRLDCWFWKSSRLSWLVCKSGERKQQCLSLAHFLAGGHLVTVRTSFRLFLTSYNVPLESLTSFLCSGCSSKWSNEKTSWQRRSTAVTRPRASEMGLTRWSPSMSRGHCTAQQKQSWSLCYQIALQGRPAALFCCFCSSPALILSQMR